MASLGLERWKALLQNAFAGIGCYEVILCNVAENARLRWRKSMEGRKYHSYLDVLNSTKKLDAC